MKTTAALAALAAVASAAPAAPKVSVSIFEEALCPACIGFFSYDPQGVWAAYQSIGDIMDLKMVYWGNAQGDAANPTCQHGPVECAGNLILECAQGLYNDTAQSLPFVSCIDETFMKTFPAGLPAGTVNMSFFESTATDCAGKTKLDWKKIDTCRKGPQGTEFIQAAKDATPAHDAVPFSVINGNQSVPPPYNLVEAVCAAYTGTKPAGCSATTAYSAATAPAVYQSKCINEKY